MTEHCYRHPDRETGVSCSSCGRPICPDCMTPTPVGMRCPECASQRTRVVRNPGGTPESGFAGAPATYVLIAINVVMYVIEIAAGGGGFSAGVGNSVTVDLGLFGPFVAEGEWYRMVTSGFLHANLFHIGFNMLLLFMLGRLLEPSLGTPRFLLLYFASLLCGSFGALLMDPNALTVGASGAVFGLFGAGFLLARERGMNTLAGELGLDTSWLRSPDGLGLLSGTMVPDGATPVAITTATPFDPEVGDGENDDAAPRAIDDDPASAWATSTYNSTDFGGLKDGVGLILSLDQAAALDKLTVSSPTGGWTADVYVGDELAPDLAGWGDPAVSGQPFGDGETVVDLGGATGDQVLIWITGLPDGGKVEIADVAVASA